MQINTFFIFHRKYYTKERNSPLSETILHFLLIFEGKNHLYLTLYIYTFPVRYFRRHVYRVLKGFLYRIRRAEAVVEIGHA